MPAVASFVPDGRAPSRLIRFGGGLVAAAVLLQLGACAALQSGLSTAPLTDSALQLPTSWSGTDAAPVRSATALASWWTRLGDVTLTGLIDAALQHNNDIALAQANLRQARALGDVAAAGLGPTLDASAAAQRSRSNVNNRAVTTNSFRAGLDAGWELDVFGRVRAGVSAAEADATASAANLGDVQVSVAAEVALAYVGLRGAQARLAIAQANLASQQETLQITDWRAQAGLVTSLVVEQARATTAQTQAQLPLLRTSIAQYGHSLAVLTGQAPAALLTQLQQMNAAGEVPPVPTVSADLALAFPAETLRQRADVRAAEWRVRAAAARLQQADAARYPSFQLSGSLGLSALALGSLTSGSSVVSALLGSVSVPVLDGGAARAQVRAQDAALAQAQASYRAVVLGALKEVEDALVALQNDRERQATLDVAAQAASNAALLARQRYSSGLIDFQTVLETQRTLLSTQDSVAGARADIAADHVRLYKALGGGWTETSLSDTR